MSSATNPLFGAPASTNGATQTGNTSNSSSSPSNQFNANSFISLLTAELQAQDPTNPMDPSTMMDQLVSMNSLQTLLNIQQILSTATGVTPSTTSGNGSGATANALPTAQVAARAAYAPSASNHDAIFQNNFFPASGPAN
jgi:flagellar basal-body rod modification protein FlgD